MATSTGPGATRVAPGTDSLNAGPPHLATVDPTLTGTARRQAEDQHRHRSGCTTESGPRRIANACRQTPTPSAAAPSHQSRCVTTAVTKWRTAAGSTDRGAAVPWRWRP